MWLLKRFRRPSSFSWEATASPLPPPAYTDEDGRRHRADAPYLLPKDGKEISRLDYQHYIFRHVLAGNCFAPVDELLKKGANVLDVGCGTGRWGCEIATTYPHAFVHGVDLEEVPRTASMPLNYQFYTGNVLNGLPFTSHQFQYVHQRLLVAGVPFEKWPMVVAELRRLTAPGGWLELVEMGNRFHQAGPATQQFLTWWSAMSASKGIDASRMNMLDRLLRQASCTDIRMDTITIPVGSWGGRIGNLMAQNMLAGWPSMRPLAHLLLGVAPDTFNSVIEALEEEWNTSHTSYEVYCTCGRKAE